MFAHKLNLPAAATTAEKLKSVGGIAAKIWTRERNLISIEKGAAGLSKVWWEPNSNTPSRAPYVQEEEPELFGVSRMKHSLAYKGAYEASDRSSYDAWTYPNRLGEEVLQEAFDKMQGW